MNSRLNRIFILFIASLTLAACGGEESNGQPDMLTDTPNGSDAPDDGNIEPPPMCDSTPNELERPLLQITGAAEDASELSVSGTITEAYTTDEPVISPCGDELEQPRCTGGAVLSILTDADETIEVRVSIDARVSSWLNRTVGLDAQKISASPQAEWQQLKLTDQEGPLLAVASWAIPESGRVYEETRFENWSFGTLSFSSQPLTCVLEEDFCERILALHPLQVTAEEEEITLGTGESGTITSAGWSYQVEHYYTLEREYELEDSACADLTPARSYFVVRRGE